MRAGVVKLRLVLTFHKIQNRFMKTLSVYLKDGKLTSTAGLAQAFGELRDGAYVVTIESRKKRSGNQNAYYFGVVVPMVTEGLKQAGFDAVRTREDAHLVMKSLFLKHHFTNPDTGEAIEWIGSTKSLKTVEFNLFLEQVWQWAASYLNLVIPSPNEQMKMWG